MWDWRELQSHIEHATEHLARQVQGHMKRVGIEKLKQLKGVAAMPTQFVETIMDFHDTYSNMIEVQFKYDKLFP